MPIGIYKRTKYHLDLLAKARKASIGVPHPNKSKQMIGKNNHMFGKHLTEETKAKLSKSLKGRIGWSRGLTKETSDIIRKMAEVNTGKKRSKDTIEKLSKARKGKSLKESGHKVDCQCSFCRAARGELSGKNNPMYGKCGKDAPNFKGGKSYEPYPPEFHIGLLREVRKRDSYICQFCGKTEEDELKELNRNLSIHHIDYNKNNCDKSNLITLCGKCNSLANFDREDWTAYFKEVIKYKYS